MEGERKEGAGSVIEQEEQRRNTRERECARRHYLVRARSPLLAREGNHYYNNKETTKQNKQLKELHY